LLNYINFAIQADSHNPYVGMVHTLTLGRVPLLSIFNMVLSVISQTDTRRKSAPFQVGQSLNPYPPRYRMAFAFSDISIPHLQQCALQFTCLD